MIDQILWMKTTPIKSVSCITRSVMNPEVDDYFRLQIEFEDSLLVHIEVGTLMLEPLPRWYVSGTGGTMVINHFSGEGKILALESVAKASNEPLKPNPAGPTRTFANSPTAKAAELEIPQVNPIWTDFYKNVKGVIEGKEELIVKPSEARRVLQVIEAGFASAAAGGQPVIFDKGL